MSEAETGGSGDEVVLQRGPADSRQRVEAGRGALGRQDAFLLCCCHAFRDGAVDDAENRALQELARALGVEAEDARQIAGMAWKAARAGKLDGRAALAPEELFQELCARAAGDGAIDAEEAGLLVAEAGALGLEHATAREIFARWRRSALPPPSTPGTEARPAADGSPGATPAPAPELGRERSPRVEPATAPEPVTAPPAAPPARDTPEPAELVSWQELPELPAPPLKERLRLFWEQPGFYLRRVVAGQSHRRGAQRAAGEIERLLGILGEGPVAREVGPRLARSLEAVGRLDRYLEEVERYLESRPRGAGEGPDGEGAGISRGSLEARRRSTRAWLDAVVGLLDRIEERVAAFTLGGPSSRGEAALWEELAESLAELDQHLGPPGDEGPAASP